MSPQRIKGQLLIISAILFVNSGLLGCVPVHDVMVVNCSGSMYEVRVIDEHGQIRAEVSVNPDSVARIEGAVRKAGQNDTFIFRFESKEKKKEITLSWKELLEKEWIVPICD